MMAEQNGVQGGHEPDWLISPDAINALETPQCEYGAMAIEPILEQTPERGDKRADVRWPIRLEAPGSVGEGATDVVVHDISTAGMLIETSSRLKLGQALLLSLPEAGSVSAHVVWQDEPLFGCRFDEPLPQAAVSATRLRSTMRSDGRPVDHVADAKGPEMLPARLRRLRRERGLSREALSQLTGFSKPSLWAWEVGKTMPRRRSLVALAQAFGLTEQQLLVGEPPVASHDPAITGTARPGQQLHDVIDSAKREIAKHAGVDVSQVQIRIDY